MTAPVWIASPPEVHSTLLSSGPGPGPLLASAAAWSALSAEYTTAADELTALVGAVQAGTWQGPSAEAFAAANTPYLAWLTHAGTDSAAMAVRQEAAAAAYGAALTAMPTLAELAANHATHAALLATNFFGVNTVPIALNEADYLRMWVQAATVMSTYHAIAATALAGAPPVAPAPTIVKAHAAADAPSLPLPPDTESQVQQWLQQIGFTDFYNKILQPLINMVGNDPYLQSIFSGFDPYLTLTGNPLIYLNPFNVAFALGYPMTISQYAAFLSETFSFIGADLAAAFASGNPGTIGATLLFTAVEAVGTVITDTIALLKTLLEQVVLLPAILPLLATSLVPLAAPVAAMPGLAGLAGLAALPPPVPIAPPAVGAVLAPAPVPASPVPAPAPVSPAAPAAPPAAAPPPPPAAPPPPVIGPPSPLAAGMPGFGYLVAGVSQSADRRATSRARRTPAPEPEITDEPAAVPAAEPAPARRRRRAKATMVGRGYEYMDLEDAEPAGLTALAEDSYGGRAVTPLLPGSWGDDR